MDREQAIRESARQAAEKAGDLPESVAADLALMFGMELPGGENHPKGPRQAA